MQRTLRVAALSVAGFVVLALALDGLPGLVQPTLDSGGAEGVLRTIDEAGAIHETRLAILSDDSGTLRVQSGHHFRGWYERVLRDADVELVRNRAGVAYRAVPLDTPDAKARVTSLIRERVGVGGFYAIRRFLLFAEIRPVHLDPR